MPHILAISPLLDDAAFSVSGLLAAYARAGNQVMILTCFMSNVAAPTGSALACQLDKGLVRISITWCFVVRRIVPRAR